MVTKEQPYKILGLGAACIDLVIPVSLDFLKTLEGEKNGSRPIDLDTFKTIIHESGLNPIISVGGSCTNTIKSLSNLQVKCALLGTVGNDPYGDYFVQSIQGMGVISLLKFSPQHTTSVLCLIAPDGQRTMRFYSGSNLDMIDLHLKSDYLNGVKIVHIEGYCISYGNLAQKMMQMAKEQGCQISIDLASFEVVRKYRDQLLDLIPKYVDILFANKDEAYALTELAPYDACQELKKLCPIAVVLTGKEGCLVGHQGNIFSSQAFPAHVIDTTGAGDLFASGFLYGYLNDLPLEKCARLGNYLGGAITEVTGTDLSANIWNNILSKNI